MRSMTDIFWLDVNGATELTWQYRPSLDNYIQAIIDSRDAVGAIKLIEDVLKLSYHGDIHFDIFKDSFAYRRLLSRLLTDQTYAIDFFEQLFRKIRGSESNESN